jgi:thioester reductase-like protein
MKKVLITGITGLLGSSFAVDILGKDKNVQFLAIVRPNKEKTALERMQDVIKDQCEFEGKQPKADEFIKRIDVIEGDLSEPMHLFKSDKLHDIDAIYHCAADVNLGRDTNGQTFNINYNGTKTLLEIAKELKVKAFHYVSTAYVAGKTSGIIKEGPSPATDWNNAYEQSKFKSEAIVRASGIPFTIHRPSIIVGNSTDGRIRKPLAFYFILEFLAVIKERLCAKNNYDPSEMLDMSLRMLAFPSDSVFFVPIDYVTKVSSALFFQPCENKTYHITGNSPVSTKSIEEAIKNALRVENVRIQEVVEDPTMDEKLLHRFLGEFLPYFSSTALFDTSNVKELFGQDSIDWDFNQEKLTQMIASYYKEFFPELTKHLK